MREKEEKEEKIDFIKWFFELDRKSGNVAGGKGANLAEIYNIKIPVPPGFVVTAQAYSYFIKKSGIGKKISKLLETIDYEDTAQLDKITKEIRNMILISDFPKEMEAEVLEAYETLGTEDEENDYKFGDVSKLLKNSDKEIFVAVRSSATTEDLAEASFAGQQDSFVNVKGKSDLINHVKKCFASLFTSRATYYRHKKGFNHEDAKLAVVVQKMVDSDKSGVIFSKDPNHKNDNIIIEAAWGLGEGVVSGEITPDKYIISPDLNIIDKYIANKKIAITRDSAGNREVVKLKESRSNAQVLTEKEIKVLSEFALQLEAHYKNPQDMEFAIENEEVYIVQTRPVTTMEKRVDETSEIKGEVVLSGMGASPGIASGKIRIILDLKDLSKIKSGDILVTKMTNPDMVVSMQKSAAIVTDDGGLTAHAAIVSREMGIPAVVGTHIATTKLKEGEIITVDGTNGKIYKGKISENIQKEIMPVTAKTKTEIKVMLDLPSFAGRAAKTKLKKTGLTRIEGIISESGKHPNYFIKNNRIEDYENILFKGIKGIAEFFDEIWVRTSDIRSDEFRNLEGAPKEIEANPMLGMHGIRYGIKNPKILLAELKALKRIADNGKKIGVMMPQVININELKEVKKILKEIKFDSAKVGIMVETPAAVQIIKEFCQEGMDFISFGTNDLTQYMLAVDRGNKDVQHLYDEMHPAVLYQIAYVIRVCKRNNVETSICGQAGSKKEMVKFLVENGIDSISVNADAAKEISEYVAKIENEMVKGTDKEPRKYQSEKEEKVEELPPLYDKDEKEGRKSKEILPEINGIKKAKMEFNDKEEKRIEKDIEAIEKEKKECLESGECDEVFLNEAKLEKEKDEILDIF
jgi:pyruvate,water dikinase